ncbi:hypothetical protein Hanom_Chr08g00726811 [Helianthus anomalus]
MHIAVKNHRVLQKWPSVEEAMANNQMEKVQFMDEHVNGKSPDSSLQPIHTIHFDLPMNVQKPHKNTTYDAAGTPLAVVNTTATPSLSRITCMGLNTWILVGVVGGGACNNSFLYFLFLASLYLYFNSIFVISRP